MRRTGLGVHVRPVLQECLYDLPKTPTVFSGTIRYCGVLQGLGGPAVRLMARAGCAATRLCRPSVVGAYLGMGEHMTHAGMPMGGRAWASWETCGEGTQAAGFLCAGGTHGRDSKGVCACGVLGGRGGGGGGGLGVKVFF